jgi:hypothetical protein
LVSESKRVLPQSKIIALIFTSFLSISLILSRQALLSVRNLSSYPIK